MLWSLPTAEDPEAQSDAVSMAEVTTPALEEHLSLGFSVASYQWSGLELAVRDKMTGKAKQLLRGVAGTAFSGDFVALMGPSGEPRRPHKAAACKPIRQPSHAQP